MVIATSISEQLERLHQAEQQTPLNSIEFQSVTSNRQDEI
jgi:hypothetical protein